MLTTLLRFALIEAKAVGTAAQALSSIQTESFDLYLLDARFPAFDRLFQDPLTDRAAAE